MKIKNLKINPGILAFALALSLVSCHQESVRRERETRDNIRKQFDSLAKIRLEEVINYPKTNEELEIIDENTQKTR